MSVILFTGGSLYDVHSCLATWFHFSSGGLCAWSHVPSGGSLSGGEGVSIRRGGSLYQEGRESLSGGEGVSIRRGLSLYHEGVSVMRGFVMKGSLSGPFGGPAGGTHPTLMLSCLISASYYRDFLRLVIHIIQAVIHIISL